MRTTLALLAFAVLQPSGAWSRYEECINYGAYDYGPATFERRQNQAILDYPVGDPGSFTYGSRTYIYGYLPPASHPNVQWFMRFQFHDGRDKERNTYLPVHVALLNNAGELVHEARLGVGFRTVRGINSATLPNLIPQGDGHRQSDGYVRHDGLMPGPNELLWARVSMPYGFNVDSSVEVFLRVLSGEGQGFLSPIYPMGDWASEWASINPASNFNAVGLLRLVNPTNEPQTISFRASDDQFLQNDPGQMSCTLQACRALTLTAQQLERGTNTNVCAGNLGDGAGKWHIDMDVGHTLHPILNRAGIRNRALDLYSDYPESNITTDNSRYHAW